MQSTKTTCDAPDCCNSYETPSNQTPKCAPIGWMIASIEIATDDKLRPIAKVVGDFCGESCLVQRLRHERQLMIDRRMNMRTLLKGLQVSDAATSHD